MNRNCERDKPKQLNLFEPSVIKEAFLTADSPRQAFYNLRLEVFMGNWSVRKESGSSGRILDKRTWLCESLMKAEKLFNRLIRNKTDPNRRSPRKYRLINSEIKSHK